jgi:hypothetical protein
VIPAHVPSVEGQPFYSDLGFLADLCLLGFLGITARDSMVLGWHPAVPSPSYPERLIPTA